MSYYRQAERAKRQIEKRGQPVTIRVLKPSSGDKPWEDNTDPEYSETFLKGVASPPKRKGDAYLDFDYNGQLTSGSVQLLFPAYDSEPTLNSKFELSDGLIYELVSLTKIAPGGVTICYKGLLKK